MIPPDLSAFEADAPAAKVLAELKAARWRKARDAAKELCRKDKLRYLPLLVAANAGLAQDLLSRGLVQDAEAVLEYLKTIAPPELMADLQARQAESLSAKALIQASGGRRQDLVAWRLAEVAFHELAAGREVTRAGLQGVDYLVTSPFVPPDAAQPLAVELRAVREAVQATGEGQWEAARAALQGLPRGSVFQHWRLFLRGVRHTWYNEKPEAQRCFDALPAGSGPAQAAALFRELRELPPAADSSPAEARLTLLTVLAGLPPTLAAPLVEAQRHWERGKLDQAYESLANPLRHHFPTDEPGFGAILTDVVLASCAGKAGLPHVAQQDLVASLLDRYDAKRFRSDREMAFALRFFFHEDGKSLDPEFMEEYGLKLASVWSRLHGPDPLRESALWTMIAGYLQPAKADGTMIRPLESERKALQRMYERAAALDPDDPAAAVRLAQFHEACGSAAAYNEQLTALAKRFPEDKSVLLLGAEESVRRKSWPKALKALRLAHAADPMDTAVASLMITVLQEQAMSLVRKGQPVDPAIWQEMEPLLLDLKGEPGANGLVPGRLRWAGWTVRGLMEDGVWKQKAAGLAPGAWAHHFLNRLLMQRFGFAQVIPLPDVVPSWLEVAWMHHLARWDHETRRLFPAHRVELAHIMEQSIVKLHKGGWFEKDPAGLLQVTATCRHQPGDDFFGPAVDDEAILKLIGLLAVAARKKKASYQIRLAAIILPAQPKALFLYVPGLEAVVREAGAAGDGKTVELASHFLGIAKSRGGPDDWENEGNEDEDEEDEDEAAEANFGIAQTLAAMIKLFSKSQLEETRRLLEAEGMDRRTWEEVSALGQIMASTMTRKEAERIIAGEENSPPPPARPAQGRKRPAKTPSKKEPPPPFTYPAPPPYFQSDFFQP
jgi:tetratricopeptide (TPR) repeat protein